MRSAQPANRLTSALRQAIWSQGPDITIARVKTLDSQLTDSLAPGRFQTSVLVAFGIGALLLAMLGIYGVLSYTAAGRKHEIGVSKKDDRPLGRQLMSGFGGLSFLIVAGKISKSATLTACAKARNAETSNKS